MTEYENRNGILIPKSKHRTQKRSIRFIDTIKVSQFAANIATVLLMLITTYALFFTPIPKRINELLRTEIEIRNIELIDMREELAELQSLEREASRKLSQTEVELELNQDALLIAQDELAAYKEVIEEMAERRARNEATSREYVNDWTYKSSLRDIKDIDSVLYINRETYSYIEKVASCFSKVSVLKKNIENEYYYDLIALPDRPLFRRDSIIKARSSLTEKWIYKLHQQTDGCFPRTRNRRYHFRDGVNWQDPDELKEAFVLDLISEADRTYTVHDIIGERLLEIAQASDNDSIAMLIEKIQEHQDYNKPVTLEAPLTLQETDRFLNLSIAGYERWVTFMEFIDNEVDKLG